MITTPVPCKCGHAQARHLETSGLCTDVTCDCDGYVPRLRRFIADDGETPEERDHIRRAMQRAQLDDVRGARRHHAVRAITWGMVAALATAALLILGWYLRGQ